MTGLEFLIIPAIIAGGAITVAGQLKAADAAEAHGAALAAQGRAQRKIAEFNAQQKEREARSRMESAAIEEERVSKREKIFKAEQRVRFQASNISVTESSSMDFLMETAGEFQMERALTLRQGLVESNMLKDQAAILRAQGVLAQSIGEHEKWLGAQQKKALKLKAAGTILSTVSSVGAAGGLGSSTPSAGTFKSTTGQSMEQFGRSWISS